MKGGSASGSLRRARMNTGKKAPELWKSRMKCGEKDCPAKSAELRCAGSRRRLRLIFKEE